MSPRAIILSLAGIFAIAGLYLGLSTVHADGTGSNLSTSCGSVLKGGANSKFQADLDKIDDGNLVSSCHDKLSSRKPLAYGALGLAGVALIAGVMAPSSAPTNPDGSKKPSIWR